MSAQDGEEGVGETGEGDMAIPAVERAQFIIGEADFLFGHFEGLFNPPAATGDLNQFSQGGASRGKADIRGEVFSVGEGASDEEGAFETGDIGIIAEGEQEPVEEAFSLGAGSGR